MYYKFNYFKGTLTSFYPFCLLISSIILRNVLLDSGETEQAVKLY